MKAGSVYVIDYDDVEDKKVWRKVGIAYEIYEGFLTIKLNDLDQEFHVRNNIDLSPEEWERKEEEKHVAKIQEEIEKIKARRKEFDELVANAKILLGED